ncbi:MAG: ABC transporter substrate-binding protein [Paracoccus sp. (in: a-proteobacteria)]|uniref:ABC transporter substrate-binding protein n=1 Tax=Paracoccus sp. TaxID=267 RepID=UPI0026DF0482|nr:ABC transporter substrate-binding protein [Paracoccus sp. (in: a-proteobacteria)]MDO5622227.1 ABC transporter substrate-binding protein [Paracoccus sp. (in: a-proteobacteria)]
MRKTFTMIRSSLVVLFLVLLGAPLSAQPVTVTDILGRGVTLPEPAQRIVLGEARHLSVLGLMLDDPVSRVVGWRLDKPLDPPTLQAYRQKFPAIDRIVPVGAGNRALSVEAILGLQPDLLVLSLMDQNDPAITAALDVFAQAGIAVVYVDFFAHPQENTLPSLHILGALTGAEARAGQFADFYTEHLNRITERLADPAIARPGVFVHVHAAPVNCCSTVGEGVFNDFVTTAGGRNITAETVKSVLGTVSMEYLLAADPDFYVATGGTHMAARGGLVLGPDVAPETAAASFAALTGAPGFSGLRAVREGQAAGIWHMFNDSPSHIVMIEYLAKMLHPDLFADVDPAATLAEIGTRFSPVQVPGTWWVGDGT